MTALTRREVPGLVAGLAAFGVLVLLPPPAPITELGMARLGLLAFSIIWWVATPLPLALTTLAALGLGVGSGALTVAGAFAHSSSWVLWFVIGSFGLAAAFERTGVNRRLALAFLDIPWARGRSYRFLLMFLASATLMSAVLANTVVAVIWLALAVKIYRLLDVPADDPMVEANTLGIAWAANIGGIATPVGNGTNVAAIGLIAAGTGVTVTFLQWTVIGTILTVLFLGSALVVFRLSVVGSRAEAFGRPELAPFISAERAKLGPVGIEERWAVIWMAVAISLWFLPDIARLTMSPAIADAVRGSLHMSVPALLVPVAMCLLPVPGAPDRRVLAWNDWLASIDWALVIFIGGVMGIGAAIGEDATGIPAYIRTHLEPALGGMSEYGFVTMMCGGVVVVTSLISNMVTLAIFLPLGLTMATSLGIADPVALGVVLGIGPSLGYLLPSGTTTNAIVAGSGFLRVGTMVRHGAVLVALHALLLALVGYPLAKLIVGR